MDDKESRIVNFNDIKNKAREKDVQKFTNDLLTQGNIATVVMMPKEILKTEN